MKYASLSGPCRDCAAACCRNYTIALTGFDVVHLAHRTSDLSWLSLTPSEPYLHAMTAFFFIQETPSSPLGSFLFTLARKEDDSCVFLSPNNRCTVYDVRPLVCRSYPFMMDGTGKPILKEECRCPRPWTAHEQADAHISEHLSFQESEIRFFYTLCTRWNAEKNNAKTREAFLSYVFDAYTRRGLPSAHSP